MASTTDIRDRSRTIFVRGAVTLAAVAWAAVVIARGDDHSSPTRTLPTPAVEVTEPGEPLPGEVRTEAPIPPPGQPDGYEQR